MVGSRSNPTPAHPVSPPAHWVDAFVVGLIAFALRATLIAVYPFVYGGDPIIRLIESDRVLISYQLPGLQVVIFLMDAIGGGVVGSRLAVAAISSLAAAGLCRLVSARWSREVAILAALIFACNPYVVYFSAVPYQFPLVLAAVHWSLYFYVRHDADARIKADARIPSRIVLCSMCIGIACLTRYEAWIFAACLGAAWVAGAKRRQGTQNPSLALRALISVALFGWGPIAWLAFHRAITPPGTFVIGGVDEWGQLLRPLTTGAILLGLSGPLIVAVSMVGLGSLRRELQGPRRAWWVFAFVWLACSSIALVFSAHPVEPPSPRLTALLEFLGIDPTSGMFVTPREGHLYVSLLSIVAALGIARIGRLRIAECSLVRESILAPANPHGGARRLKPAARGWSIEGKTWRASAAGLVTVLLVGHSVWIVVGRIERAGSDPELQTAVAAARVVDALLDRGGRAIVLARPIPPEDINDYLRRAGKAGGLEGERRAREILATIETGPPAYQRMLVHSRYDRTRLLDIDDVGQQGGDVEDMLHARDIRYCVMLNDFVPRRATERATAAIAETGSLLATVDVGVGARVYAIPHGIR